MEVKGLKFQNGMDAIGKNLKLIDRTYYLEKAVAITITQTKGGSPSMGFLPLTFFGANAKEGLDVEIEKNNVLFVYEPSEEIKNGYTEFSTGIQPVQKPKIIT